ncbi:hypothetical protein MP228_011420 [Amoeboaphelidium protococcarum]|nr:hypothetical protein MP228_011420 [Amoeboaphelidium protococcarum]
MLRKERQEFPQSPPNAGGLVQSFVGRPEWEPTEDAMHYFQRVKVYCDQYQGHRLVSPRFHIPQQNDVVDWCRVQSFKYKALQLSFKFKYKTFKLDLNYYIDNCDYQWLNENPLNWVKYNRLRYTTIDRDLDSNFVRELQMLSQTLSEAELSQFELAIVGEGLSYRDPKEFLVQGWRITLVMVFSNLMLGVKRMEGHRDVQLYIDDRSNSQEAVKRLQSSIEQGQLSTTMKADRELHLGTDPNLMGSFFGFGNFDFSLMESVKYVRLIELGFRDQRFDQELFVNKVKQFFGFFEANAAEGQIKYKIGVTSNMAENQIYVPQVLLEAASSVTPTINVQFFSGEQRSRTQLVSSYMYLIALGESQPFSFVSPFSIFSPQDITMFASAVARVPTMLEEHQRHPHLIQDFKIVVGVNQLHVKYFMDLLRSILLGPFRRVELIILYELLWQQLMELNLSEMVEELNIPNHFELLALSYVSRAKVVTPIAKQSVLLIGDAKDAWFLQSKILSLPTGIPEAVDEASSLFSQTDIGESVRDEPPQNQFTQTMRQSLQWLRSQFSYPTYLVGKFQLLYTVQKNGIELMEQKIVFRYTVLQL